MELQHTTVEHIALMHQFQCTKCLNICKTQKHSIDKKEKKSPGNLSYTLRRQFGQELTAKRRRPKPSRTRANFSPQRNLRLTEETHNVSR